MSRVALITGAAGGIGQALVSRFEADGYRVIGLDRDFGNDLKGLSVNLIEFSRNPDYRNRAIGRIKEQLTDDRLDVLINNAAIQIVKPTEQLTSADWFDVQDVNLNAPFLLIQGLFPALVRAQGCILNISSIHAVLTKPGFAAYATSKAALEGLTRALAVDFGSRVRVNAIAPAAIATEMLLDGFRENPAALQHLADFHPVHRIGEPKEIAELALMMASSRFAFLNGSVLSIDGGIRARLHDPV